MRPATPSPPTTAPSSPSPRPRARAPSPARAPTPPSPASPRRRSPARSSARSRWKPPRPASPPARLGAFTVVHGAASQISLSGSTANLTSGATRVLTATIQDAAGNTVTSDNSTVVTFAKASGAGTVTGLGTDTAVAGVASKTVTGAVVGAIVIDADSGALTAGTLGFTVVHGAGATIELTESGSVTAGATHTLTATLKDASGNTLTGDNTTVVTFAKTGGAGTVTGLGTATASAGVATKSVTNQLAGQINLDAQVAGMTTGTGSYTIVVGPVSAATSTVNAVPSSVSNNGTDTTTITVTVRDAGGNPLPGMTVSLDDAGADSVISPASTSSNGAGVAGFTATSTSIESVVYTGTADSVTITDTATVNFVFNDVTPPTNTITLASATGAYLAGTTLYYRPAAAGSFTLSSAVADGGSGPDSATYPAVGQAGWTHALETVSTPAGGPYASSAFSWTNAASGELQLRRRPPLTPGRRANTSDTTLNVTEDSTAPTGHSVTVTGGPVLNALSIPFVLVDGSDAGAGLDTASRSVTRQVASLTNGVCGSFSDDAFAVSSPDTGVMSGNCYRYVFTIADRVGNVSATATSAAVQVDTDAPDAPTQVITESAADAHAVGSTLFYLPSGSGTFTVTATATDAQSGVDKVTFPAVGSGFVRTGSADDSTPPYSRDYTLERRRHGRGRADGHLARPGDQHRERQLHADRRLDGSGHCLHRSGRRCDARLERPRDHRDRDGRRRRRRRLGALRGLRRRPVRADRLRRHDRAVQRRLGHELRLRRAEDAARDRDRQRRQHDRRHAERRSGQGRRPARDVHRSEPDRPGQRHDAAVHLHGHRDACHLRVQSRRRRLELLRRRRSRSPPPWRTARTPSRCVRPTRPATPTRPWRATPGSSTRRSRPAR